MKSKKQFSVYISHTSFTNKLKVFKKVLIWSFQEVWSIIKFNMYCSSVYKSVSANKNQVK